MVCFEMNSSLKEGHRWQFHFVFIWFLNWRGFTRITFITIICTHSYTNIQIIHRNLQKYFLILHTSTYIMEKKNIRNSLIKTKLNSSSITEWESCVKTSPIGYTSVTLQATLVYCCIVGRHLHWKNSVETDVWTEE